MSIVSVKCFYQDCEESFVSIATLRCHAFVKHPVCNLYHCKFHINCTRRFDKWNSYRKHLFTQHSIPNHIEPKDMKILLKNNFNCLKSQDAGKSDINHIPDKFMSQITDKPNDIHTDEGFDVNEFTSIFSRNVTVFIAKLYSKPNFPRNHVDSLINDITLFLSDTLAAANLNKIIKLLESAHIEPDIINAINIIFKTIANPFMGLSSEYLRIEHFKSTGDYIPPETYVIDSRIERSVTGGAVKGKMKQVTGQFIPLRKVLKKFFELPDAFSSTINYMNEINSSDIISNIIQCQKWDSIKTQFYNPHDFVIPLIMYYDDWEPNNALGPHSEKIGCVYANLPTLPEECQSKLENIFEVLIFNADDRKTYGNKKIFRPLIEELKFLEKEGILINTPKGEERVFFPTVLLIGDNLGINSMCGFVESFSANYMCRYCKASKHMTERMTTEDQTCLRDSENYANDVALNDASKTGIKEEFVFKDVKTLGFDIPNAFAVDCMHDGPEGIAHYTMIPVLKHLLRLDSLFLETLNCRMYMFDYGLDINNKPPSITREILEKKKLKMTASEMSIFVGYFGLFVGDLVSEDDEYWQLYLLLRDIFEILQCRYLTVDAVPLLQNLVSEHHKLYMKLTNESLKPKHHFLLHYPRLFSIIGPFAPISSMRNEGKHKTLKKYTNVCMSRKNILFSLAVKRQISQCYRFIMKETILPKLIIGSGNFEDIKNSELYPLFKNCFPAVLENNSVWFSTKWIEVKGTLYKKGMAITYGVDESKCWHFAEIKSVYVSDGNDVIFVCLPMENLGLNAHVRGFEVVSCNINEKILLLPLNSLNNPFAFTVAILKGEKYIMTKRYG